MVHHRLAKKERQGRDLHNKAICPHVSFILFEFLIFDPLCFEMVRVLGF
jgi:hypothetical protein